MTDENTTPDPEACTPCAGEGQVDGDVCLACGGSGQVPDLTKPSHRSDEETDEQTIPATNGDGPTDEPQFAPFVGGGKLNVLEVQGAQGNLQAITQIAQLAFGLSIDAIDAVIDISERDRREAELAGAPAQVLLQIDGQIDAAKAVRKLNRQLHKNASSLQARAAIMTPGPLPTMPPQGPQG